MLLTAVPTPSPTPVRVPGLPGLPVGKFLGGVGHGLWLAVSSSPWVGGFFVLALLFAAVQVVHGVAYPSGARRDPVRRFPGAEKREIIRRAGGRCEGFGWITRRCGATEGLEADHVHPHSRGGWTHPANGQALCRKHNRSKSATIPFGWQMRGLARRRATYFPPGVPGTVVRRAPRR